MTAETSRSAPDRAAVRADRWSRAVHSLDSIESVLSIRSRHSTLSGLSNHAALSVASTGSILSFASAGSILSFASAGSILSFGSAGSIMSIGSVGSLMSRWSLLSVGGRRERFVYRTVDKGAATLATVAIVTALVAPDGRRGRARSVRHVRG